MDIRSTVADTVQRNAPVAAVTGLSLWGVSLADWVYILTIIYLLAQMSWLGYKAYSAYKEDE
jgi:hypothetical protein